MIYINQLLMEIFLTTRLGQYDKIDKRERISEIVDLRGATDHVA